MKEERTDTGGAKEKQNEVRARKKKRRGAQTKETRDKEKLNTPKK